MRKFQKTLKNNDSIAYCKARREYKNLLYKKKKQFNGPILNELIESVNDQKTFWDTMHRVQSRKTQLSNNITSDDWFNHFKSVLEKDTDTEEDDIFQDDNESFFNRPISKEEVLIAINKSKPRKAAGPDGVIGEMMKYEGECVVDFLVELFQYFIR